MVTQVSERMPRGVKGALVVVWCQAVLNGLVGWLGWTLMNDRLTHHQDVADPGLVRFSVLMAFSASAVLFVSGVFAWKRFGWVRVTVLVVECAIALFSLVNVLVAGVYAAGLGLAVAALTGSAMLGAPAREWFNR
ncbi:hypothetical protein OG604_22445 [Streptomyces sp. NBC_01231]|nr:hypothetical protein OG604_22445 [Streptomyces sp. NBC_01231]